MQLVTLLFLRRNGEILLAMKKRGFGADKWNGFGGKVELSETPLQGIIRECQEEIGVTPTDPKLVGRLKFYEKTNPDFCNDAHIFVATEWHGDPYETEEMRPRWFAEADIPFADMWSDDILWLPLLLAGKKFAGTCTLDGDDTTAHDITEVTHFED